MSKYLCISVTFLDGRFHGKLGDHQLEWPPSPLRLFQAIVNANASQLGDADIQGSLQWLEKEPAPIIVAPPPEIATGYTLSVPNNAMDIVARAWCRGNYFGTGDANPATHRTMKRVRPVQMRESDQVHYLWKLDDTNREADAAGKRLTDLAKRVFRLGWGLDLVACNAQLLTPEEIGCLRGERWKPGSPTGPTILRVPCRRTLIELQYRHNQFLTRFSASRFTPVDPMTQFDNVGYHRAGDVVHPPYVVFELRTDEGDFFAYPQRKLIHITGMVRHVAIQTMKDSPPPAIDNPAEWIDQYITGHVRNDHSSHRQLSYLPLPSIGHLYADQAVRRVMVTAPQGDEQLLEYLARRLAGQRLEPQKRDLFGGRCPPTLIPVYRDRVAAFYTQPARVWASVTPVVLPGHTDRKKCKTVKLIEKALRQSGIGHACSYEWRSAAWWPKSLTAYKYDRDGNPTGYFRPDHLESLSLIHLKLLFEDNKSMPGPIAIGAGRHCGLGTMARLQKA